MDKINVMLYNTRSNKEKCRAEIVMCDSYKTCSLYKEGKCLNVTAPFSDRCRIGKINKVEGYTQRAMKYYSFTNDYKNDEKYGALKNPSECYIFCTEDKVYLNPAHIYIHRDKETGKIKIDDPMLFSMGGITIDKAEFTTELFAKICRFHPHTVMGYDEIVKYQSKTVPELIYQAKKIMPEFFEKFALEYPDIAKKEPNFIGKKALLSTLNKKLEYKDSNGSMYHFETDESGNEYLIGQFKSSFLPFNSREAEIKIPVTDKMTVVITDNAQVTDETIFV